MSGFIKHYHRLLAKYKVVVIIFWLIITGFGVWIGPKFLGVTILSFAPPHGSPSEEAENILTANFPDEVNSANNIVVFESKIENKSIINQDINDSIKLIISKMDNYQHKEDIRTIQDYFSLVELGYPEIANELVSSNKQAMIMIIDYNATLSSHNKELRQYLETVIDELSLDKKTYFVGLTGISPLMQDIETGTKKDIAKMDSIVLPLALLILALVLQSLRLMIIPIITIGISTFTSFMLMYPVARYWLDVGSFAPSVMMSTILAISIDYSLFLLSRYKEELLKGKTNSEAVNLMNKHAGHTIMVSGLTLAISFIGLAFFPMDILSSIGIGASLSVVITLFVNLTLTPAILLTFSKFFSSFTLREKIMKKIKQEQLENKDQSKEKRMEHELSKQLKSIWYKISKFSTKYSVPIILVILVAAIPISIQAANLKHTVDTMQVFPRNSASVESYNKLLENFNAGEIEPYYIIITTGTTNGILNQSAFNEIQHLIDKINSTVHLPYNGILSIFTLQNGMPIPFIYAQQYLDPNAALYHSKEGALYRLAFERYVNNDNSTAIIEIQTPFDPFRNETFVYVMRDFLKEFENSESSGNLHYYLGGGITNIVDSIDEVYALFPTMIIITILVIYVVIGLMFRSAFVPLRLLITIALTLSWIYGLSVLVFEENILDWLFPVLKDVDAMYWITPIMAFSILIGLGLDYDVFLLSRVSEYRRKGYYELSSLHKGVYRTGGIISAAGIIMATSFSGLLLSSETVLNEFGFMLSFAVLLDTFIIRPILVPAIMALAKKWNWWPYKMPEEHKDDMFIEDEIEEWKT